MAWLCPEWAARYVGIPYVERGREYEGADCWGLVVLVQRDVFGHAGFPAYEEIHWPHGAGRAHTESVGDFARNAAATDFDTVPDGEEVEGDIVLLRMRGQPIHVGIVLGNGMMLHTEEGGDAFLESYRGLHFGKRVIGFYRVRP